MTAGVPRMLMFAGPNGSGKSTIKTVLSSDLLGIYVNPDDIQKELSATGQIDLAALAVNGTTRPLGISFASRFSSDESSVTRLSLRPR